jgi:glycosyltransferase involved in cell wall biosynthesis
LSDLTFSVIITNWKRQKCIPPIINQLSLQSYPKDKYEVLIIDDNTPNKDEVYSIVKAEVSKHPGMNFRFFETHKNVTKNVVLRYNIGIRQAKNDLILLNESDILMQGEYLARANVRHCSDQNLWLGAEVINLEGNGELVPQKGRWVCDLGATIRRQHLLTVRGFDERVIGWGGVESNLYDRLVKIGVHYEKDSELSILHKAIERCGISPEEFWNDTADVTSFKRPENIEIAPNPESWGTLNTLEEIRL